MIVQVGGYFVMGGGVGGYLLIHFPFYLIRTKRMVVDVLRVQPGENLTSVLYTPATQEQEEEHQTLIRKREQLEQDKVQRSTTIRRSESMSGDRK